ncbi:hypothetical protein IJ556_00600, partial [bacterium]|nr:hypothetical protein [bacterium]
MICPNCLYADKGAEPAEEKPMQSYSSYSAEPRQQRNYDRPQQEGYRSNYRDNGGYQRRDDNGYRREGGYNRDNRQQGGYQRRDNNN